MIGGLDLGRAALFGLEHVGRAFRLVARYCVILGGDQIRSGRQDHWVDNEPLGCWVKLSRSLHWASLTNITDSTKAANTLYASPPNGRSLTVDCVLPSRSGMGYLFFCILIWISVHFPSRRYRIQFDVRP